MKRKEFLKKSAALGVGLPFLTMLMDSCSEEASLYPDFDVDFSGKVIVIGAGAAGLTAGYVLNKYNIDFQIIEASSVFGGRVKRIADFAYFPIDLGAEWIHARPSVLARLISDSSIKADIDIIRYSPDTIYNWKNDKLKKQNWASNFYSEYKFKSTTWYGFFEKYIAPDITDNIIYNSPVSEIDYSGDKVAVKNTNGDVFEADRVLITIPIKILQSNSISFTPNLPSEKTEAIDSINMPDGLKVFIEFSERFYPDILVTGNLLKEVSDADKLFYDAAFRKDTNRNVLGLFTVGEKASVYTSLGSDDEIFDRIMSELDEIFDGKASQTYVKHVVQNWSKEPYIQGSYGIDFNNDQSATVASLVEPVNNKLFFAGEALHVDNGATVHGAGESAYTAVQTILETT